MWFKILIVSVVVFLSGFSCGTAIMQHSSVASAAEAQSNSCIDRKIIFIEEKSITTLAPEAVCDSYDKKLTFEQNILNTIGETPSIKLQNIAINGTELYVKAEYFNPASSVKDRLALSIIENAEKNNLLKKNQTVVEATSGNTGIGLAMVCAAKKYDLVVTMPDSASIERRKLMRFLGAKVILTPAAEGGTGAYNLAKELVKKNDWFFAKQFENQDNAKVHEQTTGQEIYNDFKNIGLDYWVSGYGTGGTFTGVSRILRKKMPNTKLILTEPDVAPLIKSNDPQKRNNDGSPSSSHPKWNPHPIQGLSLIHI